MLQVLDIVNKMKAQHALEVQQMKDQQATSTGTSDASQSTAALKQAQEQILVLTKKCDSAETSMKAMQMSLEDSDKNAEAKELEVQRVKHEFELLKNKSLQLGEVAKTMKVQIATLTKDLETAKSSAQSSMGQSSANEEHIATLKSQVQAAVSLNWLVQQTN